MIDIQDLSKRYTLATAQPYIALRDVITKNVKKIFQPGETSTAAEFWALQDVSFSVNEGERIGIIGRNGAGKSTLLKILSKITPPTRGKITLHGRLASLLEIGTGFHPELTGRENIFLNGAILGLKKTEISKQMDAIVDFSGVEHFIDVPLKQYSSGMQLRLAFSVAAHLEPEILLIDEVLAVGDLEFQKKCLGKMEEVSKKHGRTILFVSHNMDSIRKFCTETILLEKGRLVTKGSTEKVINEYIGKHSHTLAETTWMIDTMPRADEVRLEKVFLHDEKGNVESRFDTASRIGLTMEYEILGKSTVFTHGLNLYNQQQVHVFSSHDVVSGAGTEKRQPGKYSATVWIPQHLLPEGIFTVGVALFRPNPLEVLIYDQDTLSFEVFTDFTKQSARGDHADDIPGVVRPLLDWKWLKH